MLLVSLPNVSYALSAFYVIAEESSNLARYESTQYGLHVLLQRNAIFRSLGEVYARSRTAGFGAEVKRRVLLVQYTRPRALFCRMTLLKARLNFLQA